jgi:hypothetical protein
MSGIAADSNRSRFLWLAAGIVFIGLLMRAVYVLAAQVDLPIRGDSAEYVLYAWNMVHRGVYSMSLPTDAAAVSSGFRAPGYPWLLASMMRMAGHSELPLRPLGDGLWALGYVNDTWMRWVLYAQVLLGTMTIALSIAVSRFWLRPGWALLVGVMVAFWPQSVTFTGALLSETLFAFSVMLAVWLCLVAQRRRHLGWMVAGGLAFGFAYLVNPIIILLPMMWASGLFMRRSTRTIGLCLFLVTLVAPGAWAVARHADPPGQNATQHAEIAFVVGTWPDYYSALAWHLKDPVAARLIAQENIEQDTLIRDPRAGLALIRARMADDPLGYVRWFVWEKPFLDWDWSLRLGGSDIAFPVTTHSPYDDYPSFRALRWGFRQINPWLYALSLLTLLWMLVLLVRKRATAAQPWLPAAVFICITLAHVILQAEPRYSLPFRPIEFVLVVWLLQQVAALVRNRRSSPQAA